jgi:hypothetical protein
VFFYRNLITNITYVYKKNIFFLLCIFCLPITLLAQDPDPCNCNEETTIHTITEVVCAIIATDPEDPENPIIDPNGVVISITYSENVCGDHKIITVMSRTVHSAIARYEAEGIPYITCDDAPPPFNVTASSWQEWWDIMDSRYLPLSSPGQVVNKVSAPCLSTVSVQWPAGTVLNVSSEGHTPRILDLSNMITSDAIPCGTGCCLVQIDEFGHGTVVAAPPNECEGAPDLTNYSPTITTTDPITGLPNIFIGTIIEVLDCEYACHLNSFGKKSSFFETDLTNNQKNEIELSVAPTLAHSYVKFSSKQKLRKIEVFDMRAKKVLVKDINLEIYELDVSALKEGIYYTQITFDDNIVKTIKIYKK